MSLEQEIYNKLTDKIDSHERSLTLISKAVEDINGNLDRFTNIVEQQSKDMQTHYRNQDNILNKLEMLLEDRKEIALRFKAIEDKQQTGCPNFLADKAVRIETLKKYDLILEKMQEATNKNLTATQRNREEIDELRNECHVHKEKIHVANNRIKDLESLTSKGMWAIATAFLGIIIALIQEHMG